MALLKNLETEVRESKEHGETFAAVAGITEDHQRFAPLVGTFRVVVRFWMGPGDPVESSGSMRNELTLGGRFLRQVFQGDPMPGSEALPADAAPSFAGEGYLAYNNVDKRYESVWVDNASTLIQVESGQIDEAGREWNFYSTLTNPQSGGPMEKRTIITIVDEHRYQMEIWFRDPDGPEIKAMEMEFVKAN